MAYVEDSMPHVVPTKNAPVGAFSLERVNRIVFVDSSNFNGSSASVKISSNYYSISSNCLYPLLRI